MRDKAFHVEVSEFNATEQANVFATLKQEQVHGGGIQEDEVVVLI
jgi:hypothetical protein